MSRRGSGLYARSHSLFCVTAAAAAAPSASPTTVPPPPGWRTLPIHSWQARRFLAEDASPLATSLWATRVKAGNGNDASAAEHRVHLLGARLGPRPLVFIPSFGPLAGYEAALAAAQHKDGVVALSYQFATPSAAAVAIRESRARRTTAEASVLAGLSVPPAHVGLDYDNDGFISDYCHSLAAVLHCLDAAWVHVVGHSVGGLVAAKMALLYPRLVGTVTLIDTPLATRFDVDSDQQRETIHSARVDVNVPRKAIDEAVAQLKLRTLGPKPEPLLASPTETDATVYAALFDRNGTFSADATARDASAWLSVQHLRMLRQPVHTILPPKATTAAEGGAAAQGGNKKKAAASAAVAAAAASDPAEDMTRELVPVRKATHMKAGHPTAPETAAELGQALSAWIARFDADAVIARTWTRAKDEVSKAKPAATEGQAAAAGTTAPAAAGAKGGDKKGKKGNAPANKKP